jgi:predicted O-methyltransferase YrrM
LRELRDETSSHRNANMQISPEQGQFMQMLWCWKSRSVTM